MRLVWGTLLLAAVALLIRSTALSVLASRGVIIDVLALATVVWGLRWGESGGSTFGFVLGLAADLDAAHRLGRHAFVLALVGYAVGRLSRVLVRDNPFTQLLLLFTATVVHQAWALGLELVQLGEWRLVAPWAFMAHHILLSGLVTAPLGVLLLGIVRLGSGRSLFPIASLDTVPRP
jgi:rod shape-determining protein MreD